MINLGSNSSIIGKLFPEDEASKISDLATKLTGSKDLESKIHTIVQQRTQRTDSATNDTTPELSPADLAELKSSIGNLIKQQLEISGHSDSAALLTEMPSLNHNIEALINDYLSNTPAAPSEELSVDAKNEGDVSSTASPQTADPAPENGEDKQQSGISSNSISRESVQTSQEPAQTSYVEHQPSSVVTTPENVKAKTSNQSSALSTSNEFSYARGALNIESPQPQAASLHRRDIAEWLRKETPISGADAGLVSEELNELKKSIEAAKSIGLAS